MSKQNYSLWEYFVLKYLGIDDMNKTRIEFWIRFTLLVAVICTVIFWGYAIAGVLMILGHIQTTPNYLALFFISLGLALLSYALVGIWIHFEKMK